MEIILGLVGFGWVASVIGFIVFALKWREKFAEGRKQYEELRDLFFGKGLKVRYHFLDGMTKEMSGDDLRTALGGRKDEFEVLTKRYFQNKERKQLDLARLNWTENVLDAYEQAPKPQPPKA